MHDDLLFLFRQLRSALDAAYAAPEWDSERIDRITRDMLALERNLAAHGVVAPVASVYTLQASPASAPASINPRHAL